MKRDRKNRKKEILALRSMSDAEIDYSDIPATTAKDWVGAVRGKFYRPRQTDEPDKTDKSK